MFPFITLFIILGGGWLSDNAPGGWKHKHWTRLQTVGALLLGPAVGLLFTGLAMLWSLSTNSQPFIFERWWLASSFIVLSIWLFIKYCKNFLS